jgi:hypothetical protein
MKALLLAIALLVIGQTVAEAACPAGTRYMCYPQPNGKQQCGCFR